ncbi:MAG: 50S ribosomal protein L29 [bacterium]|nr:50S ribosomal protein L29 [bacterium]
MKIKEIAEKKDKELDKFIADQKAKLLKSSFDVATKETGKVREIRVIKKDIARALTVKRERELVQEEAVKSKETK